MQNFAACRKKRKLEELNLLDDFLFTEASNDEQTSEVMLKLIIERATGLKVDRLSIESQKTVNGLDSDMHGIRMDVFIREITEEGKLGQLFDIEPHNFSSDSLPKRSRYYQALADVKLLDSGMSYDSLPNMWTIWILPYDPFGKDYMLYSVKNVVEEDRNIVYNDGVNKIFLYTKGSNGGTSKLKNLLLYLENSVADNAADEDLKNLHSNIQRLKNKRNVEEKYMNLQEAMERYAREWAQEMAEEMAQEMAEEMAQEKENNRWMIINDLLEKGKIDDLKRAAADLEYRAKIFEECKR